MKNFISYTIFVVYFFQFTELIAQQPLLQYESDFKLKAGWQEFMPDVYAIDDSIILSAGLNNNLNSLSMNLLVRWMHVNGSILREKEILNIDNSAGLSFNLTSFRVNSAIDQEYIYINSFSESYRCSSGNMNILHHFCKVRLSDGEVVKDTFLCFNDIRVIQKMATYQGNDTLYLYGSMGFLNQNPKIILSTMTKDFNEIEIQEIRTPDTHILPLGDPYDPRTIVGSHNRYADDYENQDVWFGKIQADSIHQDFRMKYFNRNVVTKTMILDDREKAFLSYDVPWGVFESSIYLFRDDTLRWNFYDASFIELDDIQKIDDHYCILESSFRNENDKLDKIILHFVDEEGFPYGSIELITPWIVYTMNGLLIGKNYFAFVLIKDYDVEQQVKDGEILKEEAHFEYTHVFKFRINE